MASLLDLTKSNLSYYTVPAAFAVIMLAHTYAGVAAGKNNDAAQPRRTEENCLKDTSMDKVTLRRIHRAKAAASNGFESLGFFAAAVVAANVTGVPVERLNFLSLGYLASRIVYNYVYIFVLDNTRLAPVRSLVWMISIVQAGALFVSAGNKVNSAA